MISKPNCSTCDKGCLDGYSKNVKEHSLIYQVGCLSHPQAREYLMQDVLAELERIEPLYYEESGIRVAIHLIKEGVDK